MDWIGIIAIVVSVILAGISGILVLLMIVIKFAWDTINKKVDNLGDNLHEKIDKNEKTAKEWNTKMESVSQREDDGIKDSIVKSEGRIYEEVSRRISNTESLFGEIKNVSDTQIGFILKITDGLAELRGQYKK